MARHSARKTIVRSFVWCALVLFESAIPGNVGYLNFGSAVKRLPTPANYATENLAQDLGYSVESYEVTTADGYILNLVRVQRETGCDPGKTPVLVVHGLLSTSAVWLALGAKSALASRLADDGFDVWLGNVRGGPPSQKHVDDEIRPAKFWSFTPTQQGRYDVPAFVDAVRQSTGKDRIFYLGYSSAAQLLFIHCHFAKDPCESKIRAAALMAPILDAVPFPSLLLRSHLIPPESDYNGKFPSEAIGANNKGFPGNPSEVQVAFFAKPPTEDTWKLLGIQSHAPEEDIVDKIRAEYPVPSSMATVRFYRQLGRRMGGSESEIGFKGLDWGFAFNLWKYGTEDPPEFNLKNTDMPVFLIHGDDDDVANEEQTLKIAAALPTNSAEIQSVQGFSHSDFLFSRHATAKVYDPVIAFINEQQR